MNIDKNRKIRDVHRTFVYKTVGNVEKILTEHVEDLTSFREKLTALKSLLIEKLETTKTLDETIVETAKARELEKEIEDSGEFCEHVYSILAKIDLRLEEGKYGVCKQTPVTNQEIGNTGNTESAKVKLPKSNHFLAIIKNGRVSGTHFNLLSMEILASRPLKNLLI